MTDPNVRTALSEGMLGGNAARVEDAPVNAVFAADLEPLRSVQEIVRMEAAAGKSGRYLRNLPSDASIFLSGGGCGSAHVQDAKAAAMSLGSMIAPGALPTVNSAEGWAFKAAGLAAMTFMYAATAAGLSTHAMEGLDARAVRSACRIPDRFAIPLVVSLGYPLTERASGAPASGGVEAGPAGGSGSSSAQRPRSPRLPIDHVFKSNSFLS